MKTYNNTPYCLSSDNRGGYWVMSCISTAEFHGSLEECREWARKHDVTIYHDGRDIVTGSLPTYPPGAYRGR